MPRAARLRTAVAIAAVLIGGCSDAKPESASSTTGAPTSSTTSTSTIPSTTTTLMPSPGAIDVADPTTPGAGNGGYDVDHYDLTFDVASDTGDVVATTRIRATATQDLSSFNLDLEGFTVDAV